MKTHALTIIASGLDPDDWSYADRFYEAGCSDATISLQKGLFVLEFDREAETFRKALVSAIHDVKKAGATIERVEPDHLVSSSEIAERSGLTRSAVSLFASGKRGTNFPAPIARVTSESPLWDWAMVAGWMFEHGKIAEDAAIEAASIRTANIAIVQSHYPASALQAEISRNLTEDVS
ncbi:hypothetical protein [Taklimakanibacter lacteus]|uniref:hypothetical protein n=1 Tax=Taklimakanibacter lacteus TaxID=2268456 RepID=UPI0034D771FD